MEKAWIFTGTWAQRTEFHLLEFYEFLNKKIPHKFVKEEKMRELLEITKLKDIKIQKKVDLQVSFRFDDSHGYYHEDGTVYCCKEINVSNINELISALRENEREFENRIMRIFKYIYGAGAPTPKVMFQVTRRPAVVVLKNSNENEVKEIFEKWNDFIAFHRYEDNMHLYFGKTLCICVDEDYTDEKKEYYRKVANFAIFVIDFRKTLDLVLKAHREIWEEIDIIRNRATLTFKELPEIRDKLLDLNTDISYIKARLDQMKEFLHSKIEYYQKEKLNLTAIEDAIKEEFTDHSYMSNLWKMTLEYNTSTIDLLSLIYDENTEKELNVLQIIFIIGTLAELTVLGYISKTGFNLIEFTIMTTIAAGLTGLLFILLRFIFEESKKFKRVKWTKKI